MIFCEIVLHLIFSWDFLDFLPADKLYLGFRVWFMLFRSILQRNWAALPYLVLELLFMQLFMPSDLEQLSLESNPCELAVY